MIFIGRETWGAKHEAGVGARDLPTSEVWLHHTATKHLSESATPTAESQQMRVIEGIGEQRFGYGFSYNLAIFPSGRAYVGCGVRRVGSHTAKRNTRALGIVLVGNYEDNPVSPMMKATLVEVLRFGFKEKWIDAPAIDGGHRDLKATSCPGRYAYSMIPEVNRLALTNKPAPAPTKELKMFFVYTGVEGLDWGTDLVTRQMFETQQQKSDWITLVQKFGHKVVRIELTEAEQEVLIPVGAVVEQTNEPVDPAS